MIGETGFGRDYNVFQVGGSIDGPNFAATIAIWTAIAMVVAASKAY